MKADQMTLRELAGMIDHTDLHAYATDADMEKLCGEAAMNHFAMVAVNPYPVALCKKLLQGSGVHVGAAVAFPLGQTDIESKVAETKQAIRDGAEEIDYVLNIGKLRMGDDDYIRREMQEIVSACREAGVLVKVIFENCYLSKDEIRRAAEIAREVRPDYIKTSTGFGTGGATVEDVRIMKETVGDLVKVKAAGGIRTAADFKAMIEAGAERIGTSAGVKIMEELKAERRKTPRLFTLLPEEYVCTPDSMAIDRDGSLILSCPNYADDQMSGCVIRIDKDRKIQKWFDVPVHPETGIARNMGICFDRDWNLYICDNQGWSGREDLAFKGRMLKVSFNEDRSVKEWHTVASGMEHPNGVKIYGDYMYVTQSYLTKVPCDEGLMSCVYRFPLDARDIEITNTLADESYIFATFVTKNPVCVYGVDGIEIDRKHRLFVGNYGDAEVEMFVLDEKGDMVSRELYAKDPLELNSTDGMIMDEETGILYIADFNHNAIVAVLPDRSVQRLAQSPDCDGLDGSLDQPGEPIIWDGRLIASCFDLVTDETKFNTAHEMPATMSEIDLL